MNGKKIDKLFEVFNKHLYNNFSAIFQIFDDLVLKGSFNRFFGVYQ